MKQISFSIYVVLLSVNIAFCQQDPLMFKYRSMAVQYQQSVKMAEKNLEGANSLVSAAKAGFLPTLDFGGNYNYLGNPLQLGVTEENPEGSELFNKYQVGLWISQPVITGGYLKNTKNMAMARSGVAQSYIGLNEQNTMLESDAMYLTLVTKKEINQLVIKYRESIGQFLDVIQDRVDEEISGMNELYQTKVRYNDAEYEVIRSEKEFRVSLMELNRLIGVPLETNSQHMDSLLIVDWSQPEEERVEKALQLRPEISLKENQVSMNQYNEKIAASSYNPQFNVGVGATYGAPSPGRSTEPGGNYLFTANLAIPIFYWGQKNDNVFAMEKITDQTKLELEKTIDIVTLQVTTAYYELQRSQDQVDFAFSSLDNAVKNVEVMLDRYQEGLSSVLEVLDSQLFWQKSNLNYIQSKFDLNVAYSTYLKAMGELRATQ
jgi:outer membrane protein